MPATVASARYGKDNVRLYKVTRCPKTGIQYVNETTVCVLLEGDIATSYTHADNSCIVATDTVKNTIYILAKQHPVTPPELFASTLAAHFPTTYPHIHSVHVSITTHRWTRMTIKGSPHPHSFYRDGTETRNVAATFSRQAGFKVTSSIKGLTVLKSTGSAFHGFVRDSYTTLPETHDRILSTDVDASWQWKTFSSIDEIKKLAAEGTFDKSWEAARRITMETFAEDYSASVQATMYKMSEQILEEVPGVEEVTYELPNKHYFEVNLEWHKGLKNTGKDAEVYAPQSGPNGLIKCTVARQGGKAKL